MLDQDAIYLEALSLTKNNCHQQRFGASGVDGRTMSISNAAVQRLQQDVNYLALELNLYISISIGIGSRAGH
jgi:hypothetical protein